MSVLPVVVQTSVGVHCEPVRGKRSVELVGWFGGFLGVFLFLVWGFLVSFGFVLGSFS